MTANKKPQNTFEKVKMTNKQQSELARIGLGIAKRYEFTGAKEISKVFDVGTEVKFAFDHFLNMSQNIPLLLIRRYCPDTLIKSSVLVPKDNVVSAEKSTVGKIIGVHSECMLYCPTSDYLGWLNVNNLHIDDEKVKSRAFRKAKHIFSKKQIIACQNANFFGNTSEWQIGIGTHPCQNCSLLSPKNVPITYVVEFTDEELRKVIFVDVMKYPTLLRSHYKEEVLVRFE